MVGRLLVYGFVWVYLPKGIYKGFSRTLVVVCISHILLRQCSMNGTFMRICSALTLCLLCACSLVKNKSQQGFCYKEEVTTASFDSYTNLASSHVIAYQDSLLSLYNVDEGIVIPFYIHEPDEIFSFTFDPDGKHMYYTVVRKGKLSLRQATFSGGLPKLEDLGDLGIDKDSCLLKTSFGLEVPRVHGILHYQNGELFIQSDFSWDGYYFSKGHIFTIASRTLQRDVSPEVAERFYDAYKQACGADRFVSDFEQLYYHKDKQLICVSDKLKLQEDREGDPSDYLWCQVSPDQSKVIFTAVSYLSDRLCIADADGSHQQLLAGDAEAIEQTPLWMGNRLYFIDEDRELKSERAGDCTTSLYVTDPTTNERSRMFDRVRRFAIKLPAK